MRQSVIPFTFLIKLQIFFLQYFTSRVIHKKIILIQLFNVRQRCHRLSVRIGKWNLGHYEHDSSIDTKDIELYLHPYFDTRSFENDLALIRLKTPVLPNGNVYYIKFNLYRS